MRRVLLSLVIAACVACARPASVDVAPAAPSGATSGAAPVLEQHAIRALADPAHVEFLIAEGTQRSQVPESFAHLTDVIGPRLTGSAAMRRANDWVAAKLREYGADSVALEPWPFGISWQRGPLTARLLEPHERWVSAASWAWSPGTGGARAGDVVYMDATTRADFDARFAGRLRGAWILLDPATPRHHVDAPGARDSARVDSLRRVQRARGERFTADQRAFLRTLDSTLMREGVAGTLIDGGKDYGLFTMSGSPDAVSPYPQIVITNETYAELQRVLARGHRARFEVNAVNTFGRDTLTQWNTVGEIRGAERPDEIVLLGAHLDSWDLGTGATDNAAGSIAVLEAARILGALKRTGVRPRRTIRFAFFTGEEQGLFGSQYYVLQHAGEMPRFQAVLVLDNGTGRIVGVPLQGQDDLAGMWAALVRPLAALGPIGVRSGRKGGTDHLPFLVAAVPSFNYDQLRRGYDRTHHSQIDVLTYGVPEDITQAATVMAVNAFQLASLDRLLPRARR